MWYKNVISITLEQWYTENGDLGKVTQWVDYYILNLPSIISQTWDIWFTSEEKYTNLVTTTLLLLRSAIYSLTVDSQI